jgi:uncharacterized membrane protein
MRETFLMLLGQLGGTAASSLELETISPAPKNLPIDLAILAYVICTGLRVPRIAARRVRAADRRIADDTSAPAALR